MGHGNQRLPAQGKAGRPAHRLALGCHDLHTLQHHFGQLLHWMQSTDEERHEDAPGMPRPGTNKSTNFALLDLAPWTLTR
jgi:hypothetical protein